ncbi:MAG: 30S ribosomal protein S17 [Promethearchaeota archaeon]
MSIKNSIGIPGVVDPIKKCDDKYCPFHGSLKLRGKIFTGVVIKKKMHKTITVQIDYAYYIKKYQRYERRRRKYSVHCSPCLWDDINVGDRVRFMESRPISKTVSSVVIQKIEKEGI